MLKFQRKCEQQVPGRVSFLGHSGECNRLADLFANADAFVHPNPREPFGIAPLKAMAQVKNDPRFVSTQENYFRKEIAYQ